MRRKGEYGRNAEIAYDGRDRDRRAHGRPEPTAAPTPTAEPTATPTAAPTPTPTATPEPTPTPLFLPKEEGSNDLVINQDLYESFTETEFPLPSAPVVLIYHTHAEEAYRQTRGYAYEETGEGTYKTLDKTKSVAALGELLKGELEQRGFTLQDPGQEEVRGGPGGAAEAGAGAAGVHRDP